MRFNYKGNEYFAFMKAYTLNDGEYYVCFKKGTTDMKTYLIPTDSEEVHPID